MEQSKDLYKQIGDKLGEAHLLLNISQRYFDMGEREQAYSILKDAETLYSQEYSPSGKANLNYQKATYYQEEGKWAKSLDAYKEAEMIAVNLGNDQFLAEISKNKINSMLHISDPETIMDEAFKAGNLFKKIGEYDKYIACHLILAQIGKQVKTIDYAKIIIADFEVYARHKQLDLSLATVLEEKSDIYMNEGISDTEDLYLDEAEELYKNITIIMDWLRFI